MTPGSHFMARDLVRGGEPVRVEDKLGSQSLARWDRLAARLLPIDGRTYTAGGALRLDFGDAATVVEEMTAVAEGIEGQLTCTRHLDKADPDAARRLVPILERKAGRLLANGFPTGVGVSPAMVHGGPCPASTDLAATSVGTLAVRRFLRPVAYQEFPTALLPDDLKESAEP